MTLGEAFGDVLWFVAELFFKFIPGTVISLSGAGSEPPVPAGLTPFTEPLTTEHIIDFLERTSSPERFSELVYRWDTFVAVSMGISLVLTAVIIYCFVRIRQLRYQEHMKFKAGAYTVAAQDIPRTQLRWNRIREQIASENMQNWRLAILEADIMLNELLDLQGYKGETIGDKLKQVDRGDFHAIDAVWEAHRVRNRIAHEGVSLELSGREAQRVIGLYERAFKEFGLIQ